MNPYAKFLDGRDILDILRSTPGAVQTLIAGSSPEALQTAPAPGKWSVREVLAHLADCEMVFAFRLRQALSTPGVTLTPFDQDLWAKRYSAYPAAEAMRTFAVNREWNLSLLTTVSAGEFSNTVEHPERGSLTFRELLETIAGHDLNHLGALQRQLAPQ